jgi:flagellar hook-basal body complex protein FliE
MSVIPVTAIDMLPAAERMAALSPQLAAPQSHGANSFAELLLDGVENVSAKLAEADSLARAFILDDSIPVHQVTFALEQARLSLELMLQVRGRLVEGYQQLMNMQL